MICSFGSSFDDFSIPVPDDGSARAQRARSGGPRQPRAGGRGVSNAPPRSAQTSPHRCHVRLTSDIFYAVGVAFRPRSTRLCRVLESVVSQPYVTTIRVSHNTTLSAGGGGGVRLLLVFPRSTIDNGKESARTIDVGTCRGNSEHGSGKNLHMTDRISCRAAQHPAAAASTDVAHGTADRAAATGTAGPLRLPLARRCLNPVLLELTEW
jgi:hypothetical protein